MRLRAGAAGQLGADRDGRLSQRGERVREDVHRAVRIVRHRVVRVTHSESVAKPRPEVQDHHRPASQPQHEGIGHLEGGGDESHGTRGREVSRRLVRIDLGGGSVVNGDGLLLLQGGLLYVVQNQLNQIAVVKLTPDYLTGKIVRTITSNLFHVPTTLARFDDAIYAVNARFDVTPTPATEYQVVRVPRR